MTIEDRETFIKALAMHAAIISVANPETMRASDRRPPLPQDQYERLLETAAAENVRRIGVFARGDLNKAADPFK